MQDAQTSQKRREQVIAAATELFWRKGFDAVSIGDVVSATGMNRYSLYQTFGGKRDIFRAILEAYMDESRAEILQLLARPDKEPIDGLRDAIVNKMLDPAMFPAGCLMCTTAVDVAAKDPEIAEYVATTSHEIGQDFAKAYEIAQTDGRADPKGDPQAFAELSHALYFSTGVQARMGRSREDLLAALESVVASLRYRTSA